MHVRIPADLHAEFTRLAAVQDRKLNKVFERALREWLKAQARGATRREARV